MLGSRADHETASIRGPLEGRFVVLGVTGGIAAYKAVEVCRMLVDLGAHVAPVLTEEATRFVGPLTFSALASEPARTQIFDSDEVIPHTRLGQSADVVVVAPATRGSSLLTRLAFLIRFSPQLWWRRALRWWSVLPCTQRCGSTRRSRRTSRP